MLDCGISFFPDVNQDEKSAQQYYAESLDLVELADELGLDHARIVEHYFRPYGGYSPNPMVFLSAAAMRSRRLRLITGAVLPAFNHPLKLAGEIGMLDAISGGRAEIGFARAFLPHEFQRFGIDMDSSRARFDEGIEAVDSLLSELEVSQQGRFHSFPPTTSLPRPTQSPRPPMWLAGLTSEQTFRRAGELGYGIMAQPVAPAGVGSLLQVYRQAWHEAGHPGDGRVMLVFHMYCDTDRDRARKVAGPGIQKYLQRLTEATSEWLTGASSVDYPGYSEMLAKLKQDTFEGLAARGSALVGTPNDIVASLSELHEKIGGFEVASMQTNFSNLDITLVEQSLRLFAAEVMPELVKLGKTVERAYEKVS